ncbi:A24 family peptidase [Vibrio sp. Isolate30]|uniref:A24 family peptidase n=1 Tax=Vibrio TaxID=662 RepID=UPI001EFE8811|nr:A24 family peptidase [Vibrio sp. Isolate30]MCG9631345.1 A24 family peptidase [Vibrio sp. Isolate30]
MIDDFLPFWIVLLIIAVCDVSQHRIPNRLLILMIMLFFLQLSIQFSFEQLRISLIGGLALFLFGLLLYFVRAMSAGDVKLLGVIGLYVGWGNLQLIAYYITISAGIVGVTYICHHFASHNWLGVRGYFEQKVISVANISSNLEQAGSGNGSRYKNKVTMPFAPAVVIGLAMYSYFN